MLNIVSLSSTFLWPRHNRLCLMPRRAAPTSSKLGAAAMRLPDTSVYALGCQNVVAGAKVCLFNHLSK